jgi:SAM-dependent methyltransferase
MALSEILSHPLLYQTYQEAGGWFGARVKAIHAYLPLKGDEAIIDIGCGPGKLSIYFPPGVSYTGFDPSLSYIEYARRHFGSYGQFHHGYFDNATAKDRKADVVMLNGVLHHMTDEECNSVLILAQGALRPDGRIFTLDGCYVDGQHAIARWLLDHDRGQYVRTASEYSALISRVFKKFDVHLDHALSRVPYSFMTIVAHANN